MLHEHWENFEGRGDEVSVHPDVSTGSESASGVHSAFLLLRSRRKIRFRAAFWERAS